MIYGFAKKASALPSASRLSPYASALLSSAWGMAMAGNGRAAEAEPLLRRVLETATARGDAPLRAYALLGLGWALSGRSVGEACKRLGDAANVFRGIQICGVWR